MKKYKLKKVIQDMDATIAKFNDALVDMGLEVKKIKE